MKLDLSSIIAGEYLFWGFILFTAPELFFNPVDGYFKAITVVRTTALESNHLNPITEVITNLVGAGFLSLAAMLLMANNPMKKNDVLRIGFYLHVFLTLVCGLRPRHFSGRQQPLPEPPHDWCLHQSLLWTHDMVLCRKCQPGCHGQDGMHPRKLATHCLSSYHCAHVGTH